jgi:hypothetical protein
MFAYKSDGAVQVGTAYTELASAIPIIDRIGYCGMNPPTPLPLG